VPSYGKGTYPSFVPTNCKSALKMYKLIFFGPKVRLSALQLYGKNNGRNLLKWLDNSLSLENN
jgi:hypothetical protein